ncbi:hypothetical protein GCM10022243_64840 [Saccharothrix violaceirubra]|uniref:Uncharacterized protein n=1 Tax=Saccharothrix violaceirubra TaxID=413306 RepID=A0A7W7TC28_9PSEU|nr:hypothetical protein [Saccharothrix violaceirubra]MBB4969030.1 hypothetical protein [Saccharothrix violaceirubra]
MCRAGGRRCKGSSRSGKATQTHRKRLSRARKALRNAQASGDQAAIAAAQHRLDQLKQATQDGDVTPGTTGHDAVPTDTPAGQNEDVTDQHQDQDRKDEDVTDRHRTRRPFLHNTNTVEGNARVGSQHDIHVSDHTSDRDRERPGRSGDRERRRGGRTRVTGQYVNVNIADGNDHVTTQVGFVFGNFHNNG